MKILETNPNGFLHPNSLMPPTWYLISTLHIPPSLVLSHYSEHAVTVVPCLCVFSTGIFVKIVNGGLHFYFYFYFYFIFLFLEQLGLGFVSHAVTSVTSWWRSHKTDHETWENRVKGSGIKWRHTIWTTHVDLMSYTWSFRVGCTVVSMDHE